MNLSSDFYALSNAARREILRERRAALRLVRRKNPARPKKKSPRRGAALDATSHRLMLIKRRTARLLNLQKKKKLKLITEGELREMKRIKQLLTTG
jgi:hypothetical protein